MSEGEADDTGDRARRLFSGPVTFLKSAPALHFLPDQDVPEVAFCGRSNVGKSSLLALIAGARKLQQGHVQVLDKLTEHVDGEHRIIEEVPLIVRETHLENGVPIDIVSTGPERDETILKQHPFK